MDLLTCTHQNTETVEKFYPEPLGIENVLVCKDCGKEIIQELEPIKIVPNPPGTVSARVSPFNK